MDIQRDLSEFLSDINAQEAAKEAAARLLLIGYDIDKLINCSGLCLVHREVVQGLVMETKVFADEIMNLFGIEINDGLMHDLALIGYRIQQEQMRDIENG